MNAGWGEGTIRARSWSGTEPLPPEWFLVFLIEAARSERQRLQQQCVCPVERLSVLTEKLMELASPIAAA
jgi:hypothetical protein